MGDNPRHIQLGLRDLLSVEAVNSRNIIYCLRACARRPYDVRMKQHILPLLLIASLAGCSNMVETRVTSSGQSNLTPKSLLYNAAVQPAELTTAYNMVAEALGQKGFAVADNGVVHLQVTLSSRPAQLAIGTGPTANNLSPAKQKKALQSCADKEYRLAVILTQIADGTEIYRGSAAEYHCNLTLTEATQPLVAAALADLGNPRGAYIIKRNSKD